MKSFSFFEVPDGEADRVLHGLSGVQVKGRKVNVEVATGELMRPEKASRTVGPVVMAGVGVTQRAVATVRNMVEEKPTKRPCPAKERAKKVRIWAARIMHGNLRVSESRPSLLEVCRVGANYPKQPNRLVKNGDTPHRTVRNIRKTIGNSSSSHKTERTW